MKLDLQKGIALKIEGELGRHHTLPIDNLIAIANNLQELIFSIAKLDLPIDNAVNTDNFKIELSGFEKSSAVPTFVFTPRIQQTIHDYKKQRALLSNKVDKLLSISNVGSYRDIKTLYPDLRRNEIVDKLFAFTSSFSIIEK